ncbi:hypothetical protein [Blastococcus sp. CT_GayMR16]|uniref:hypothetical protein n=1 Tax=Blastococcus sp. CT_GayMR16 TaxID=2559607 RepID=UPI0010739AC1|nr:hypothetical protein [Blastococcus sp. CT_GayMR16]TFV83178.1 hypothetical protein E4P38_21210 [Blastococcus sp. CT_GayMR16]
MRAPLLLVLIAATLTACSAGGGGGGGDESVVYTLESDAPMVSATYATADSNGIGQQQELGVAPPWTKTVQVEESLLSGNAFVLTGSMDPVLDASGPDGTTITCRIEVGGEVVAEQTSTGQYATATCTAR